MKYLLYIILSVFTVQCNGFDKKTAVVKSPDGNIKVEFNLNEMGKPYYTVSYHDKMIIDDSFLGFDFANMPKLSDSLEIENIKEDSARGSWRRIWGPTLEVPNNYNLLEVDLVEKSKTGRKLTIVFKVYDDGIGFRYLFPKQQGIDEVLISDELSEFQLTTDNDCWWGPGDWDSYEHLYSKTKFSKIDGTPYLNDGLMSTETYIPDVKAVNTPITMRTPDGNYLSFHEADLTDYAGMTLSCDTENMKMRSALVAWEDGIKVKTKAPFKTPWRTMQIAGSPAGLIQSNLIENLNEECKIENTDWIYPQKYIGLWWAMHVGKYDWEMGNNNHGTTTERAKEYIDFAKDNGIKSVLVEGWNDCNAEWILDERKCIFDWVTSYPDYDFDEVIKYANKNGIKIIGQQETNGMVGNYMNSIEKAYNYCNELGIETVKPGYVGRIIPAYHYQQGQWMVQNFRKALEVAANHKLMLFVHETIKPTGLCRTYPNLMAQEAARGQEFNAPWSARNNTPEHTTILPFTRLLAGSMDFTPGIFDIKQEKYKGNNQIPTTLAKQLALFVVLYSPVQMAGDIIENYKNNPAFQFIRDVPVDWDEQKIINAEIGEYLTIARKEKGTANWALGSITNEGARDFIIPLTFLNEGINYEAYIYSDGANAHWQENPNDYFIYSKKVNRKSVLTINLAEGGGQAIYFKAIY